jgi:hypothetical protein
MAKKIQGGCHCGAVRYVIDEAPEASMICHCQTCRRVSGGVVVAWISVAEGALSFTQGAPAKYASSPNVERQFCAACGAQLTYRRTDEPYGIDITTVTLDDANAFPPTHHSWLSHDLDWVEFGDGRPTFPQSRAE